MVSPVYLWILLILGIVSRLLVPWLLKRRQDPFAAWDWRYIYGQLITAGLVLLVLPFVQDLYAVADMLPAEAYIAGWFAADIGLEADKFLSKPA